MVEQMLDECPHKDCHITRVHGHGTDIKYRGRTPVSRVWMTTARRELLIDFATWMSEQEELDVDSPDHAVDMFIEQKVRP